MGCGFVTTHHYFQTTILDSTTGLKKITKLRLENASSIEQAKEQMAIVKGHIRGEATRVTQSCAPVAMLAAGTEWLASCNVTIWGRTAGGVLGEPCGAKLDLFLVKYRKPLFIYP